MKLFKKKTKKLNRYGEPYLEPYVKSRETWEDFKKRQKRWLKERQMFFLKSNGKEKK